MAPVSPSSLLSLSLSTSTSTSTSTTTTTTRGGERNCGSSNDSKYHTTVCYCHRGVTNWINPTINVYANNIGITAVLSQPLHPWQLQQYLNTSYTILRNNKHLISAWHIFLLYTLILYNKSRNRNINFIIPHIKWSIPSFLFTQFMLLMLLFLYKK